MTTTFANIALTTIDVHPNNPRRHAEADPDMVASIEAMGVLTPVVVAPAGNGYILIGGHRRFDGANKAGFDDIPAVIRDDLDTEAAQLEAMLVENLHRVDLTAIEEADAYEQLALFGMDPAAIAKATGRNARTVKARLKLKGLPETTRGRLHDGQITLADAESLLEFADDPETVASLEKVLGTGNFAYQVARAQDDRKRKAATEKAVAGFLELGAVEFTGNLYGDGAPTPLARFAAEELREHDPHGDCLGYHVPTWGDPQLVCTDPASHAEQEVAAREAVDPEREQARAQQQTEWEAQREAAAAEKARQSAASAARLKSIVPAVARAMPAMPEGLAFAHALMPLILCDSDLLVDAQLMVDAAGLELVETNGPDWNRTHRTVEAYGAEVAAKYGEGHVAFVRWVAALIESQLSFDSGDPARTLAVWNWLERSAGHAMSDVDIELREALQARAEEGQES